MAKAIQLKDSNNLALLPITDSKLVQHWNGTSYVPASDYLHPNHNDLQTLSYTSGTGIQLKDDATGTASGTVQVEGSGLITITGSSNKMVIGTTANNYSHPTNGANKSVQQNAGGILSEGKSFKVAQLTINNLGHVTAATDMTYTMPTTFTPSAHSHGNITSEGKITNGANKVVVTNASGEIEADANITVTELSYLNDARSNIQSQIDTLSNTVSSGMHVCGTTTTIPSASVAYNVGDSYVWNGTTNGSLPAAQSQSGAIQTIEKGDMLTYLSTNKWAVIQNNITLSFPTSPVELPADGAEVLYATFNGSEYKIKHKAPSGTSRTVTPSGTSTGTFGTTTFLTGISYSSDANGHVTTITATKATLPAQAFNFKTITAGANSTATTGGTANTNSCVADSAEDTLTVSPGNKWITTGTSDTSNADVLYINHALVSAGTNTTVTTSGNSSLTHNSSLVITGISYNVDAAGHISSITATTGKLPADTDIKVNEWGKSDNNKYPILFSYTTTNSSATTAANNFVASDTDGATNFWYNPSTNILHAKYVNSDDSVSVSKGVTSNLNYVQGKDITLDDTFLSNALGSTTSNVTGATSSGTATVVVNHAVS